MVIIVGDAKQELINIFTNSIDLIVTDPPYGYAFMNKDWDKAVVSVDIWRECLRVLKPGAFAFIMSSPRQDVLCKMILNLIDAGFETNFTSIYWAYASGFPKAADVSKLVDKRFKIRDDYEEQRKPYNVFAKYLKENRERQNKSIKDIAKLFPSKTGGITGIVWNWENAEHVPTPQQYATLKENLELDDSFDWFIEQEREKVLKWEAAKREIIGKSETGYSEILGNKIEGKGGGLGNEVLKYDITKPATEAAKRLEGSYAGFQPKPAVEVILVCMKPLDQKTYVDQALTNQKGITWLDDCRIPYQSEQDKESTDHESYGLPDIRANNYSHSNDKDRLNNDTKFNPNDKGRFPANLLVSDDVLNDGKSWRGAIDTHKATSIFGNEMKQRGKGWGYEEFGSFSRYFSLDKWAEKTYPFLIVPKASKAEKQEYNRHPTVKPLQLMSYLITMGSRPNDIVLDPFCGSGTTLIAAHKLHRNWIGIEILQEYATIAQKRLQPYMKQSRLG